MQTLSIIVPIYKSEVFIKDLEFRLGSLCDDLRAKNIKTELIFVDDGSPDDSWSKLLELSNRRPELTLIQHWSNQGAVAAVKSGLLRCSGDAFTVLAADLQDPPELILEMVEKWQAGAKMVIAERLSREDPLGSKVFSALYYFLLRLFVSPSYPKGGFDLGLWDKSFIEPILACRGNKNIALFTWTLGVPAEVIKYHRQKRREGKSSWTFSKKVEYFMDSFIGMSAKPLRLTCFVAFAVSLISMLGAGVIVFWNLFFESSVPKIALFASVVLVLFSMVFGVFGILGEYIWRLYDSTTMYREGLKTVKEPKKQ